MSSGSRVLIVILSLVVGLAAGWLLHQPPPTPPPVNTVGNGTAVIVVGPGADDLTIRTAKISKKDEDVLFWAAKKKDRQLWIELDADIFEKTVPGKYAKYRVQCDGRRCFSGDIKPGTSPSADPLGYKYWQVLLDSNGVEVDKADGMIIIRP